jgi:hypothetical protein
VSIDNSGERLKFKGQNAMDLRRDDDPVWK